MTTGVRLATWNQILDPWVYILLRRAVLHKIYLIVKCQARLKSGKLGRWEPTAFAGSVNKSVNDGSAGIRCLSHQTKLGSQRCGGNVTLVKI